MYLIKLGGSVITEKAKRYTFRTKVMDHLARELKKASQDMIIVHGAGSFGHILAKEHDLDKGYKQDTQRFGFAKTQAKVQQLNNLVLDALHNYNIVAVSLPPHSTVTFNNHAIKYIDYTLFERYLEQEFTPVTFGDVVLDDSRGFSICSGDVLMQALATHFKPEKVMFVIDEDGLYTANPKLDKKATLVTSLTTQELTTLSTAADTHADVTKGMGGKLSVIKTIANQGIDTMLVNGNKPERIYRLLVGEEAKHTLIHGGKT